MSGEWQVHLDQDGRVIVGDGSNEAEGRYLVVPQTDGTLALHALERAHAPLAHEQPAPPPAVGPLDEDAAAAELARWGARALGDLSAEERARADSASGRAMPLVDVNQPDRPQPAAMESADPEANQSALSAVDAAYRYWLIQNRDAHDLYKTRGESSRRSAAAPSAPTPGSTTASSGASGRRAATTIGSMAPSRSPA